jgi:sec-independent protein translocase protein TatB
MFDIGTGELGLIALIALLVLGPERLPGAARTAGALLRKARQSWSNVREEIERELAAEELKASMKKAVQDIDPREDIQKLRESVEQPTPPAESTSTLPDHERH